MLRARERLERQGPWSARRRVRPHAVAHVHRAYQWLKGECFDVIHFPEMLGLGMCSVQAKRLGLAFGGTTLCVGLHGPTLWHCLGNHELVASEEQLVLDAMERRSVAPADVVVSPSTTS